MTQSSKPVESYYYSEDEWARLGCGPLPPERDRMLWIDKTATKQNPSTDGKQVKNEN
jgi:hypothetical protein